MSRSFAAVAVVTALTAVIVSSANADVRLVVVAVMLAGLVSTVAASRWPKALAWALSCCVIGYAIALGGRPALDPGAPLVAAGLLVLGEIAGSSQGVALPGGAARTPGRAIETAGLGLVSIAVAALVVAGAVLRIRGSLGLQILGAAAAVGVFLIIRNVAASKRS
jgi:hypothetical protein